MVTESKKLEIWVDYRFEDQDLLTKLARSSPETRELVRRLMAEEPRLRELEKTATPGHEGRGKK